MKLESTRLLTTMFLLSAGTLHGGVTTALGAINALGRDRGEAFQANVLQIIGVGGADQPPVWRIITRDPFQPGAIRDFAIENGRVVGDQFVPPAYHSRIPSGVVSEGMIKIDSRSVFSVANERAKLARIGFYSLDYEMRSTERGMGIWIIRLNGADRSWVGELIVNVADGGVLRERWRRPNLERLEPVNGESEGRGGRPSGADSRPHESKESWRLAKKKIGQGTREVRESAERAGKSVQSFISEMLSVPASGGNRGAVAQPEREFGYRSPSSDEKAPDAGRFH